MSYLINSNTVIDTASQQGVFANVSILDASGYLWVDLAFQGTVAGYTSGGSLPVGFSNTIDKFPFTSNANASDVGDLTVARSRVAGQSSTVSGYTSGGYTTTTFNVIDKFPFATNANASDVGDLTVARSAPAGQQN
jgi:hypothetical protein